MNLCKQCKVEFEVTDQDLKFYNKIDVPEPTLCPDCRCQRRWAWRDKNFYLRNCDKCNEKAMSWFSPDIKDVQTYCESCYRSDDFDATENGRDFDFGPKVRPFFEQFHELLKVTPRHISNAVQNENSEYIICAHKNKNCFFCDELDGCWDCYYGYNIQYCKNVVETIFIRDSEICYDTAKAENCYNVFYSKNVFNCSDSAFLLNCRGCKNCLFSANLRNKEHHIFNKPVSKEEFEKTWHEIFDGSRETLEKNHEKYEKFLKDQPHPAALIINCEDSTGDYLSNCKNVKDSFWIDNSRDCRYCSDIHYSKDCYDVNIYEGELMYESIHVGPKGYGQFFTQLGWFSQNLYYCIEMHGSQDCFGCVSLKKKKYCILNKQYSREKYEELRDRIIEHMKKTGEYGEFFPIEMSPYPYNQTMAQRFYPLTKEEALAKGWEWMDEKEEITEEAEKEIPENINNLPSDITSRIYKCSKSDKKFRYTEPEIAFYKKYQIPLPMLSPIERIERLWKRMGPRKLQDRKCEKCNVDIKTAHSNKEKLYCEKCYLEEAY
ncbi:hypothetical protein ACFLZH_05215 [Patescibacteria group bacterium]